MAKARGMRLAGAEVEEESARSARLLHRSASLPQWSGAEACAAVEPSPALPQWSGATPSHGT